MAIGDTLIGIFLETVSSRERPDQFMRRSDAGWESISSARALADVESLGLALESLGVLRGDRVGLLSENRYEWPVSDLAILGLGAVTVPIYPTLTPQQVRYILENAEARAIIVSTSAQLAKIHEIAPSLPKLEAIVHMDPAPEAGARDHAFAALLERGAALRASDPLAYRAFSNQVKPEDVATIIYTSGTTGDPKGALLTHRNIAWDVQAALQVADIGPQDRCLSFLPLCHVFERTGGLYAMLAGGASIAYAGSLDTVAADAMEVRPTILLAVPRFYEKVYARVMENVQRQPALRRRIFSWGLGLGRELARARFARRRPSPWLALRARIADRLVGRPVRARIGGRLRFGISGGAPLSPRVMEFFFAMGMPIIEGYGLTETSPVITLNPFGREKPGSVGRPLPGVEVRIAEDGEILTRGPHVMKGYYRNQAATQQALRDGWFHTGDVGHLDDESYLYITDRIKDLLVTAGGKKVAPQPIEAKLRNSPWVTEAVLLGDARPYVVALLVPSFARLAAEAQARGWGEEVTSRLFARPEVRAIYQQLLDSVNAELAQFEKIRQYALLDRELTQEGGELTPTLKVKRRVIMQKFASLIDSLYAGHTLPAGT